MNNGWFVATLIMTLASMIFLQWGYRLREKSFREVKRGVLQIYSVKALMLYTVGLGLYLFGFAAILPIVGMEFNLPKLFRFDPPDTVTVYNTFRLDFTIYYFVLVPAFMCISVVGIHMYERHAAIIDAIDRIRKEL